MFVHHSLRVKVKKNILKGHQSGIYKLLKTKDDNHSFFSAAGDGKVVKWNSLEFANGDLIATVPSSIYAMEIIENKNLLLIGTHKGQLHVVDLVSKQELKCMELHPNGIFEINFVEEYNLLVTGGADGKILFLDANTFEIKSSLHFGSFKIRSTVKHHDEKILAVGCGDGSIAIIDLDTLKPLHKFVAHQQDFSVNTVCFSPDGNYLLSGSRDAHLNMYDVKNNFALITTIPTHNYAIYQIAFSPTGKYFATASRDKTCKIWDAEIMQMILRLDKEKHDGHINSVNSLLWMNDNLLVTGSDDRTVICWELEN
jgi:WD repeat-containing protein 61